MGILRSFTPLVEPIALDEAFLDVGGVRRLHGRGPEVAARVRARVRAETGLTVSVGVAATKLVAKLASELAKPDGVRVVEPGAELAFLHPLGVERLSGVGPVTRRRLERLGVRTIGDLAALPVATLEHALGRAHGSQLHALALNRDDRPVEPVRPPKSIGHEETFPRDLVDRDELAGHVTRFAEQVAARLREASQVARTVQLKARYRDFRTVTRSRTLPDATQRAADLERVGRELLDDLDLRDGLRLLGLAAQQLAPSAGAQACLPLDAPRPVPERGALERSVEDVRRRFGADALTRARNRDRG
jgi:DNA polymerase-4